MIKHTPEPWAAYQDASGDVFISSAETSFHIAEVGSEDDETVIPDANRIVACVNACAGISNEMLSDDCFNKMRCDRDANLSQRDELLAALEGLIAIVGDSYGVSGYHLNGDVAEWDEFEEVANAWDAIAKAKGIDHE